MTKTDKITAARNAFLDENFCHEDAFGNRPCDCGLCCDRCEASGMEPVWQDYLAHYMD